MDVRLSLEQVALRDAAAAVGRDLGPQTVAALDDAERTAKLDAAVVASGWRELRVGDDAGAPLASGVEVAVVAEQLGRAAADTAFLGPTLAAELRRLAGAPPTTEPETVLLSADLAAFGDAVAVDAAEAGAALTITPDGTVHRVALGPSRVGVDLTRPTASPIGASSSSHGRVAALDSVVALGLALTAADLVGAMQGAVDLACAWAAERRQYGQPVGAFQAVQHLLADALTLTEGARSATLHAAWAVDALPPTDALTAAATAKAYAARAARIVGETAIQVHGGIGNTWECMAHVHLRRALLSADILGGVDACLTRVLQSRSID